MILTKINVWGEKNFDVSHDDVGQNAVGVPQPSGLGLDVSMSPGTLERVKNQILMPSSFHSIANTPPPLVAKPEP